MKIALALLFSLAAVSARPFGAWYRLEQHQGSKDVNPSKYHVPHNQNHYQKHHQKHHYQKHHGKNAYKKPVVDKKKENDKPKEPEQDKPVEPVLIEGDAKKPEIVS
ncbi:hypothetical protein BJ741DRAFT_575894 [Chytriomyces cf. hyalinus JEL632]|nr:hypothetical protein BJ741DRAFT_575894 [Chytriomyces cf. hyalinus JEL632]